MNGSFVSNTAEGIRLPINFSAKGHTWFVTVSELELVVMQGSLVSMLQAYVWARWGCILFVKVVDARTMGEIR
jgi:hypothetical protein